MKQLPKQLLRYLRQRKAAGSWTIEPRQEYLFDACIVIPALAESASLPVTLKSLSNNSQDYLARTLIVVVVNNRADTDQNYRHENLNTLHFLQQFTDMDLNLAWIDACTIGRELPSGQGVGLARKIGFDLCLSHLNWQSDPTLISLDADTLVHQNYLKALFDHFNSTPQGGAIIPFRHQSADNSNQERAIRRYELYLRSYCYGLQLCNSPYAYNSIGSAFACRAQAYIEAGGMNRRQAGEDFYFLQQLTKTCGITEAQDALVFPSPRPSSRVPFGTGRTVSSQVDNGIAPFTFCDKRSFQVLQSWLTLANNYWQADSSDLLQRAAVVAQELESFLTKLNTAVTWTQLQANHRSKEQFIRAFHGWFDGLRTRQLLTSLSTEEKRTDLEIVNELLAWGGLGTQHTEADQLATLEQLQGITSELINSYQP